MSSSPATAPPPEQGWRHWLHGHLRSQGVASLGLAPLSLVCFQQVSIVGFAANLLAIPFVTLLLAPLSLAGMLLPPLSLAGMLLPPLWSLAALLVQAMNLALGWMATWPVGVWNAAAAPAWIVVAALAGAALAVAPLPWRLRLLGVPLVLPLLWPPVPRPAEGRFEVVLADIGQGNAALVRTHGHLLVYDAGPQYSLEADAGQRVLVPLLRARGERQVDLLMLSHRDSDHVGGAASLMAALPVAMLSSSLEATHPLRQRGVAHRSCADGQSWDWDGVHFELLHPLPDAGAAAPRPNALSCVVRVSDAAGHRLLLTGDIEAPQEAALVARHGPHLQADALLVPHHGSRTSSTPALLDAVRPRWALVQAGYRSRFGHPAPDVVQRYADRGIEVVRSDRCGAWTWTEGGHECTRAVRRRYWHWVPPPGGAELAIDADAGETR